jgi:hypothetical protein
MTRSRISRTGSSRQVKKTKLVHSAAARDVHSEARGVKRGVSRYLGHSGIIKDRAVTQQRIEESMAGM